MIRLFIGNLSPQISADELQRCFAPFGPIEGLKIARDRVTGRSRGYGFVELADAALAGRAIGALHDVDLGGQRIVVTEARPRTDRPRRDTGRAGLRRRRSPW